MNAFHPISVTQNPPLRRRGLSLLELLVVVSLMGIFAATGMMRFGRDIFGDTGARSTARVLSLGLLQAQRAAIKTGDDHGVVVSGSLASATSWTVQHRLPDGTEIIIDGPHLIPDKVTMKASRADIWFDFEGNGTSVFTATLEGPNRSFEVQVQPLTRMIRTREVSP